MNKANLIRLICCIFLLCLCILSIVLTQFNQTFQQPAVWFALCALCIFGESKALTPLPKFSLWRNDFKRFFQRRNALPAYQALVRIFIVLTLFAAVWTFAQGLTEIG